MTTIQDIVNAELTKNINVFGELKAYNSIGYKMTFYGYIRKVEVDHIIWEHIDDPKPFKIRRVISFLPMPIVIS